MPLISRVLLSGQEAVLISHPNGNPSKTISLRSSISGRLLSSKCGTVQIFRSNISFLNSISLINLLLASTDSTFEG